MWGLDTGVDDILGNYKVVRPMRLIVIDLKTNMVSFIRNYGGVVNINSIKIYVSIGLEFISQIILSICIADYT